MKMLNNLEKISKKCGSFSGLLISGMLISIISSLGYSIVNGINTYKVRKKLDASKNQNIYYTEEIDPKIIY